MGQITLKNGKPIKQKQKKKKSFWARFFIVVGALIVLTPIIFVVTFYALFYDDAHKNIKVREDYPIEEIFNDVVAKSLDDTVTNKKIRLRVTEDQVNQLFYDGLYKSGGKIQIVDNLYVEIKENSYVFVTELNLYNFFKTRLHVTTQLKVTDDAIIFRISNLKLGRVEGLDNLAKFILQHSNLPDVNKKIHEAGFNMNFDLVNLAINYPLDKFYEDIFKKVNLENNEFATMLKEMISSNEFATLIPNSDKALEYAINLENMRPTEALHHISGYTIPEGYLTSLLNNSMEKVATYLTSGVIQRKDATTVGKYYVVGYDHLSSEEKATIDGYLTESTFTPASGTYSYEIPATENLYYIANQQVMEQVAIFANPIVVDFKTNQIDRALSTADVIGYTYVTTYRDEENNFTANYIAIDRITTFVDAANNRLFVGLSVNFNGYQTMLTLKTAFDFTYSSFADARFVVEGMYLGDYEIGEECKEQFMEFITNAILEGAFGDTFTITAESGNIYIKINLSTLLSGYGITESAQYSVAYEFTPQSATTPGALRMIATKDE